ncbi:MAG: SRPBCC family protein [Actinomycetes bacterium]
MPIVSESIHIEASPERCFDYLVVAANTPHYDPTMFEFEADHDGPMEKGDRVRFKVKVAGRHMAYENEVTEVHRPERIELRSLRGPVDVHITWELREDAGGTLATFTNESGTLGNVFGKLADPVVTRMYRRDVTTMLANLRELIELEA